MARDQGDRGDWTAGATPEQGITTTQSWIWTAVVAVVGGVCLFPLEIHGVIPKWASSAVIVTFMAIVGGEMGSRRKRGESYSLPSLPWLFLQAAIVTGAGLALVLGFLATEEGPLRMLLGIPTVALVALSIGDFLRWFRFR